jgi:hypothetical protein
MSTRSPISYYDSDEIIYLASDFGSARIAKVIAENPNLSPFETADVVIQVCSMDFLV